MFLLKTIKKLGARIAALKISPHKVDNDSVATNIPQYKNDQSQSLQDNAASNASNNNFDRRKMHRDRRINAEPNYKGPSRRFTIDRRFN